MQNSNEIGSPTLLFSQNTQRRERGEEKYFSMNISELNKSASEGDSTAQYLLGRALWDGWYGCKRSQVGEKWLVLAKEDQNSAAGLCAQGRCYELAIGGVVIKNPDKAKQCYSAAADLGSIIGKVDLANMLREEAITTTESKGKTYVYEQTATHTHKDGEKLSTVVSLLTLGAEAGYSEALFELGFCYFKGYGVPANQAEGLKLFRMAASKDHGYAKRNIGVFYENGWGGVEQNRSEARRWYRAAEAQGMDVSDRLRDTSFANHYCTIL